MNELKVFQFYEKKASMANVSGVYALRNKINGNMIFGKAKNMSARWSRYKRDLLAKRFQNRHLQNSFNFYGPEAFEFICWLEAPWTKDLYVLETLYINLYRNSDLIELYNSKSDDSSNPRDGCKWSEQERANRTQMGFIISSPQDWINPEGILLTILSLKEFCKFNNLYYNCMTRVSGGCRKHYRGWRIDNLEHPEYRVPIKEYKKLFTEEEYKNRSLANLGKKRSEEAKQKQSERMRGRQFTEEWKENISKSAKKRGVTEEFKNLARQNGMKNAQSVYLWNNDTQEIKHFESKEELRRNGFDYRRLEDMGRFRAKVEKYQTWRLCSPVNSLI